MVHRSKNSERTRCFTQEADPDKNLSNCAVILRVYQTDLMWKTQSHIFHWLISSICTDVYWPLLKWAGSSAPSEPLFTKRQPPESSPLHFETLQFVRILFPIIQGAKIISSNSNSKEQIAQQSNKNQHWYSERECTEAWILCISIPYIALQICKYLAS